MVQVLINGSFVEVPSPTVNQGGPGAEAWAVADDYQSGELLPDQTGSGAALEFTFTQPVQTVWVVGVDPSDLTAADREIRVDPFGGTPTANFGIPVLLGGPTPISVTTTTVKVFAPVGVRVTVWGNRRVE